MESARGPRRPSRALSSASARLLTSAADERPLEAGQGPACRAPTVPLTPTEGERGLRAEEQRPAGAGWHGRLLHCVIAASRRSEAKARRGRGWRLGGRAVAPRRGGASDPAAGRREVGAESPRPGRPRPNRSGPRSAPGAERWARGREAGPAAVGRRAAGRVPLPDHNFSLEPNLYFYLRQFGAPDVATKTHKEITAGSVLRQAYRATSRGRGASGRTLNGSHPRR